ncbi:uncharacterized protein G2W53_041263 [Senna tora]|uniref:Uncharacterized protein n=1 Tax=Senna tora TaxID=362788 RepID=A0A834SF66_9FABA|nr:uncharacterized protein G2W53_041263 [Senna tora]
MGVRISDELVVGACAGRLGQVCET